MLHRTLFLATPTTSLGCGTVRIGYLLKLGEQFGKVLGQVPERKLPKNLGPGNPYTDGGYYRDDNWQNGNAMMPRHHHMHRHHTAK